ncbi:deoxyuridinetriphosphatase, putative [Perkinsus marinus ATCC 50983]|uniref:Deoxyuridine 5'-triphosphate nucleotidohydrolase n=1 Tax=Perkinsus marinus (strain ATCC 50983 / TXsc) TaxID=423536 RepID=C5LX99_PERM5|nr:deoxyuridinetriphosphatase, putative [Perkinsus marinus ATCC 50983]EEQ98648.1 deoxyuridinetriphosphatase, putative [Perkinsus marinus ATCC 50983]|eukprot:XP_002765931.1 deoxyuridinetriphosphatase, putative [Perkinsus marinus ATCC 50983]
MHLKILPLDAKAAEYYSSHKTFHAGDSGLDLFVVKEQTIQPGETAFIRLGIKAAAFDGKDGAGLSWLLMARSSISKTPLRLSNSIGLIDQGYRGEIIAAVDNIKNEAYTVKEGDRLVQAVGFDGKGITMELVKELDETTRGEGGFGSTNVGVDKGIDKAKQDPPIKRSKVAGDVISAAIVGA